MFKTAVIACIGILLTCGVAAASCPTFHTLSNGTTADAGQVMDNFNHILECPTFTENVGIGVANPTSKLEIDGGLSSSPIISAYTYMDLGSTDRYQAILGQAYSATVTPAPHAGVAGLEGLADYTGTGVLPNGYGVVGSARITGAGTITNAMGTSSNVSNSANGQITNAYSLYAGGPDNPSGGIIANTYGVYIANQTSGTQTNAPYGLYQASSTDKNYFAGNVGISIGNPSYTLHVNGSVAGTSAYVNLSDKRLKWRIRPITDALNTIDKIQGVQFYWRPPSKRSIGKTLKLSPEEPQIGFIAQDLRKVLPQAVSEANDENHILSVAESKVVPVLVEAMKALKAKIDSQESAIGKLKSENIALRNSFDKQSRDIVAIKLRMDRLLTISDRPAVTGYGERAATLKAVTIK